MTRLRPPSPGLTATAVLASTVCAAVAMADQPPTATTSREQSTTLVSRALDGGIPNGPSLGASISGDRRKGRIIAFESDANDLVRGDRNQRRDIYVVFRGGSYGSSGSAWKPGKTELISKSNGGREGNGRSWGAATNGNLDEKGDCVAFLSDATNLVGGDTNRNTDAFLSKGPGDSIQRMTLRGGRQAQSDVTDVTVSGDCSRVAFVSDGTLYVDQGGSTKKLDVPGRAADPSFDVARNNDLVVGGSGGVYLFRGAGGGAKLVAPGGSNPTIDTEDGTVIAYERGRTIATRKVGDGERVVSKCGSGGNRDSRNPSVGNKGNYVAFESDATNLCTNASRRKNDSNADPDVYLYTQVRDLTIAQSIFVKGEPIGGSRPDMTYYANYIVWDSPARPSGRSTDRNVYIRWLGAI